MFALILMLCFTAHAGRVDVLNPSVLEKPITTDDPLENLKLLWRDGVGGHVFNLHDRESRQSGTFLVPIDWAAVRSRKLTSATWWRDRSLLSTLRRLSSTGRVIAVQSRREKPLGGFLVVPEGPFLSLVDEALPSLADRPIVILNGVSNIYHLQHEVAHLLDYETGFFNEVIEHVNGLFLDRPLSQRQRTIVIFYILETRAYHMNLIGLLRAQRAVEMAAKVDAEGRVIVSPVHGATFRQEQFARDIANFNKRHAAKYLNLPVYIRHKTDPLLPALIPNYPRDFTAIYQMDPHLCAQNLASDFDRTVFQED